MLATSLPPHASQSAARPDDFVARRAAADCDLSHELRWVAPRRASRFRLCA